MKTKKLLTALHEDRGVSAVEFALVAPVLFLILVGILDLGRAVNAYVTVSNAAREGTHYLALHPTAAPSALASAVHQRVVPLDPAQVAVTASYYNGSSFQPWPASPTANPSPSYTPVRVTVTYPWSAATFIGMFFPGGTGATFLVTSTVDMLR
jgi:Flp pilus assembly protein TadG